MKQPTALVAMLFSGLIFACVLTSLAVSSQSQDLSPNATRESDLCSETACDPEPLPAATGNNQPTPTLAPPKPDAVSPRSPSFELANGQPIFLKVETDQNEIEVGWASP